MRQRENYVSHMYNTEPLIKDSMSRATYSYRKDA